MSRERRRLHDEMPVEAASRPVATRASTSTVHLGDGRTVYARVFRDTLSNLIVHCGGDSISETRRLIARRVAALEAELIFREDVFQKTRFDGGEPSNDDIALYGTLADRQRRLAAELGWSPAQRDVTPSLEDYVRGRARETA